MTTPIADAEVAPIVGDRCPTPSPLLDERYHARRRARVMGSLPGTDRPARRRCSAPTAVHSGPGSATGTGSPSDPTKPAGAPSCSAGEGLRTEPTGATSQPEGACSSR